jgi:hypothetical protein
MEKLSSLGRSFNRVTYVSYKQCIAYLHALKNSCMLPRNMGMGFSMPVEQSDRFANAPAVRLDDRHGSNAPRESMNSSTGRMIVSETRVPGAPRNLRFQDDRASIRRATVPDRRS